MVLVISFKVIGSYKRTNGEIPTCNSVRLPTDLLQRVLEFYETARPDTAGNTSVKTGGVLLVGWLVLSRESDIQASCVAAGHGGVRFSAVLFNECTVSGERCVVSPDMVRGITSVLGIR